MNAVTRTAREPVAGSPSEMILMSSRTNGVSHAGFTSTAVCAEAQIWQCDADAESAWTCATWTIMKTTRTKQNTQASTLPNLLVGFTVENFS